MNSFWTTITTNKNYYALVVNSPVGIIFACLYTIFYLHLSLPPLHWIVCTQKIATPFWLPFNHPEYL